VTAANGSHAVPLEFYTWPAQPAPISPAKGYCHGPGVKAPYQYARVPGTGRKVIAEDPASGCNISTRNSVLRRARAVLRPNSMEYASRQLKSACLPGTQHQPFSTHFAYG